MAPCLARLGGVDDKRLAAPEKIAHEVSEPLRLIDLEGMCRVIKINEVGARNPLFQKTRAGDRNDAVLRALQDERERFDLAEPRQKRGIGRVLAMIVVQHRAILRKN